MERILTYDDFGYTSIWELLMFDLLAARFRPSGFSYASARIEFAIKKLLEINSFAKVFRINDF